MKIGPWHKVWLTVSAATLLFLLAIPHYTVHESLMRFWDRKTQRVDNSYERNVRAIRSMKNYGKEDIEREKSKRRDRLQSVKRNQRMKSPAMRRRLLLDYYAVAILIWVAFVGGTYGMGWLIYALYLSLKAERAG
jgi:hypothetical protein